MSMEIVRTRSRGNGVCCGGLGRLMRWLHDYTGGLLRFGGFVTHSFNIALRSRVFNHVYRVEYQSPLSIIRLKRGENQEPDLDALPRDLVLLGNGRGYRERCVRNTCHRQGPVEHNKG
jgi:hypothetical protein